MSAHPTSTELHSEHAYEAAWARREARAKALHDTAMANAERKLEQLREHEAELRRMSDERWRRRMLPLLASVREVESDFPGCVW